MERATKNAAPVDFDPRAFLAEAGEGKTISPYHKKQIVFSQGGPADSIFYIQKGRVKVVVLSEQGKEAVVGILGAGQFLGEGCLNSHPFRISTTTALEECVITAITKTAMIGTCGYQKLKLGRSGDEVRLGWQVT